VCTTTRKKVLPNRLVENLLLNEMGTINKGHIIEIITVATMRTIDTGPDTTFYLSALALGL